MEYQVPPKKPNQLGYAADAVDGGHAAVSYVETHKVDLLVLDMIMPPQLGDVSLSSL